MKRESLEMQIADQRGDICTRELAKMKKKRLAVLLKRQKEKSNHRT